MNEPEYIIITGCKHFKQFHCVYQYIGSLKRNVIVICDFNISIGRAAQYAARQKGLIIDGLGYHHNYHMFDYHLSALQIAEDYHAKLIVFWCGEDRYIQGTLEMAYRFGIDVIEYVVR
ncbi:MAG: hypothetical protein GTO60_16625 [Gammaproteobacteria bacterium]|nr:hypothetical protein [Gammaproteobacteria bacterium]